MSSFIKTALACASFCACLRLAASASAASACDMASCAVPISSRAVTSRALDACSVSIACCSQAAGPVWVVAPAWAVSAVATCATPVAGPSRCLRRLRFFATAARE